MRASLLLLAAALALWAHSSAFAKTGAASSAAGARGSASMGAAAPATVTSGSAGSSGTGSVQNNAHYRNRPPPEPSRRVSEQDCTRPLADDGANLKCK
jgi:hypothetical protein